jgi:hypothetical protein
VPAVNEVFLRYLDPALGCEGLTGVALAHLVTRDLFGYTLPAWYQSRELVRDLAHFEAVPDQERMQAGDLVWLGADRPLASLEEFVPRYRGHEPPDGPDFPATHVAICTGARAGADHLLLHASTVDGTSALWPLRKFDDYAGCRRIHAIRRLRQEFKYPGDASVRTG